MLVRAGPFNFKTAGSMAKDDSAINREIVKSLAPNDKAEFINQRPIEYSSAQA